MSIYVLTTPAREVANEFKIGRTIKDENKLLSSYTRGSGNPHIIFFKEVPNTHDYKIIEKNILEKVSIYRIRNCNSNLSEWVKIEITMLLKIISEEFENMSNVGLSDNEIRKITDNKEIPYYRICKLISLELLKKPKYQRNVDEHRVDTICNYILSNFDKPSFILGSIILSLRNKKLYIVDGLHRVWAINRIMNRGISNMTQQRISVILLQNLDIIEEKKVFKNINLSLPVDKIIVHDDEIGIYVESVKNLIISKWKKFISKSDKFKIPNININMLLNDLVDRNLIKYKIENGEVFKVEEYINKILELNTFIGEQLKGVNSIEIYTRHCKSLYQLNNLSKNIIKCESTNPAFYLGLIPGNRWVDFIFTKETF
mgnify:CR=1 FL=1